MEYKDLSVKELSRGYVIDEVTGTLSCIFCGEEFKSGLIYNSGSKLCTANRAVSEHLFSFHGGVFNGLLNLNKPVHGLTDIQQDVLEGMYKDMSNKDLAKKLGITEATVRTHKFNIQKMKREAKTLLALLEQIEDESRIAERREMSDEGVLTDTAMTDMSEPFTGNKLHPFFTQYDID